MKRPLLKFLVYLYSFCPDLGYKLGGFKFRDISYTITFLPIFSYIYSHISSIAQTLI